MFEVFNVKITPSVEFVDVEFDLRLTDEDLERFVRTGHAAIHARWICRSTFMTGALDLASDRIGLDTVRCRASLEQDSVDGRVDVTLMIVATQTMPHYHLRAQHDDYRGNHFHVSSGDVLGHAGDFSFHAKKSYDPMAPPLESCFRFLPSEKNHRFIEVDTSGSDTVDVLFSPSLFKQFDAQRLLPEVQISMVVLPTLMEALVSLAERSDEPIDGGWRATLTALLANRNFDASQPIAAAQSILDDPISSGLKRLSLLVQEEDVSDD